MHSNVTSKVGFTLAGPPCISHPKICLKTNRKAHVGCDFNYRIKSEGLFKVTGRHVYTVKVVISRKQCKIDDQQDLACRTVPFLTAWSDFQGHSHISRFLRCFFKCDVSYSCVTERYQLAKCVALSLRDI